MSDLYYDKHKERLKTLVNPDIYNLTEDCIVLKEMVKELKKHLFGLAVVAIVLALFAISSYLPDVEKTQQICTCR